MSGSRLPNLLEVVFEGRWVLCVQTLQHPRQTTHRYEILTKEGGDVVAEIRWYPRWRKYSLFPRAETVWEQTCLTEMATLLERLTRKHKKPAPAPGGSGAEEG